MNFMMKHINYLLKNGTSCYKYIIEYVLNLDNFMQPKYYDRNLNYLNNIKGNFAEKFPSDAVYWSKFNYFIELCIMKIFLCLSFCLCL